MTNQAIDESTFIENGVSAKKAVSVSCMSLNVIRICLYQGEKIIITTKTNRSQQKMKSIMRPAEFTARMVAGI